MTHAILPLLTALGATSDEVASALRAVRITAQPGANSFRNPIVRHINRHLDIGGYIEIPIGSSQLTVTRQGVSSTIELPKAVRSFLDRFHAGEFPILEQR